MYYCINNCLWEIEAILDLDGFGTGNGKNSTNTATNSMLQRGASRQGSSSTGTQAEYDLLPRDTFDDGRAGQGIVLNWDDKPLNAIWFCNRDVRNSKLSAGLKSLLTLAAALASKLAVPSVAVS